MAGKSDYLENAVLAKVFNATAFPATATIHVALFTAAPTDAGGGTEVATGSYARVAVTANTTNFPAPSGGAIANGTAITFPTASASWGVVTHFGLFDASTAGNLLYWGALTASKTVDSGDTVSFAIGDLDVTED